ncbi:MAG: diphosphate--fructose-6-phosphate 1-phosphotransferase [Vicinamibacterales bacterium]
MEQHNRLAILVGGGPAPGINSVISAATIRARVGGLDVVGIRDGFQWLMKDDGSHTMPLTIENVSRIHFEGGSVLGTSRANPTKDPALLENAVHALLRLNVSQLVTIGGDDTAFSAMKLQEQAAGRIRVVHVPKTIDNDLDLPAHVSTFGYQTARHHGVNIVRTLMVDAKTTSRWYFVIAMGRTAGHLALGIAKSAGATLAIIPEEFPAPVRLRTIVDTLAAAIIKRLSTGREDGVAVIAEGVTLDLDPDDVASLGDAERDAHGHIRLADVNLGDILKAKVSERLKALGIKITIAPKNIGYELRCVDPIPFDIEYTRDLGCCAAEYLIGGGNAVMISVQNGEFVPVPFATMINPETGRTRVRRVKVNSLHYGIARRYMIRLQREDLANPQELARLAATAGIPPAKFATEFGAVVEHEPAPFSLAASTPAAR